MRLVWDRNSACQSVRARAGQVIACAGWKCCVVLAKPAVDGAREGGVAEGRGQMPQGQRQVLHIPARRCAAFEPLMAISVNKAIDFVPLREECDIQALNRAMTGIILPQ